MAIKKNLLSIVKEILEVMESEDVNSIGDTEEAYMIAGIVEGVYYDIIATRNIPEHSELLKITALSDSDYPTHFQYPENMRVLTRIDYDVSDDGSFEYREVRWKDPDDFLDMIDNYQENYVNVLDKNGGTNLRIRNDRMPTYYTSFDDDYIVMDSYDSTIDNTLQQSKVRARGVVYPVFSKTDSHIPDLDNDMFRYLIREATSVAQSIYKGGSDPKIEQWARRNKVGIQNDRYKTKRANKWNNFARR